MEGYQTENYDLEMKQSTIENENKDLKLRLKNFDMVKTSQEENKDFNLNIEKMYTDKLKSFSGTIQELETEGDIVLKKNNELREENTVLNEEINNLKSYIKKNIYKDESKDVEISNLNRKQKLMQSNLEIFESLKSQSEAFNSNLSTSKKQSEEFIKKCEKFEEKNNNSNIKI